MSYVVIAAFGDIQDGMHHYEAGDDYPRPGFNPTQQRLAELAGCDNRAGKPLIVDVDAPRDACAVETPETPVEAPQDEHKEIPAESVEPPKKARRSRQKG